MQHPFSKKFLGAAAVVAGASGLLGGCSSYQPAPETSDNVINRSCYWPGANAFTYKTKQGDLYQVNVKNSRYVSIQAELNTRGVSVDATYDSMSPYVFNAPDGSDAGLRIESLAPFNSSVRMPSMDDLLSNKFEFRIAGKMALLAVGNPRQRFPGVACTPSAQVGDANSVRPFAGGSGNAGGQYRPLPMRELGF